MALFADQLTRLDSIPRINRRTAEVIIAEVGVDMTAFASAAHLASWEEAGGRVPSEISYWR